MKNGYFRLENAPGGFGVHLYMPEEGGEEISVLELMNYLDDQNISYDFASLREAVMDRVDTVFFLGASECPACTETYHLDIAEDAMRATARFYPASETGKRINFDEFYKDLHYRSIKSGVQMEALQEHFQSDGNYCTDILVAKGKEPRHGTDARIEYFFNTDIHAKPEMREDGSVDFFNLNIVNKCRKGEVLARMIPADEGEFGVNINGGRIKPRDVKKGKFKYGKNIDLSDDRLELISQVDGHVTLIEGSVFVSDVYTVENVDNSTGNIDFVGSVQVNGNIATNFVVKAGGDVVINGVVEGAYVEAGGNIIIARGMNGMAKGTLKAGGNVVAKFIENSTVNADGYIATDCILHSKVSAGTEITVSGKRGFITGGNVRAVDRIDVKIIGSAMGASTNVEVGLSQEIKSEYIQLQKEIGEIVSVIKESQPIVQNFMDKKSKGAKFNASQVIQVKELVGLIESKKLELYKKNEKLKVLQPYFDSAKKAAILVRGEVYPGTVLTINDASMNVQSSYKFCRFEKVSGDVKMLPL